MSIQSLIQDGLTFLFPNYCVQCQQIHSGHLLCPACSFPDYPFLGELPPDLLLAPQKAEDKLKKKITNINYIWPYEGAIRESIRRIKYGNNLYAARELCQLASQQLLLKDFNMTNFDLLVPMPSRNKSLLSRGFALSYLFANALCQSASLTTPIISPLKALPLKKAQATMPYRSRLHNLSGRIIPKTLKAKLRESSVLLIDDVITTGATFVQAVKALTYLEVGCIAFISIAAHCRDGIEYTAVTA